MRLSGRLRVAGEELRQAARDLRRSPRFALAAIAVMALGIGGGAAVFSVVDRILFRSVPYPNGERLVSLGMLAPFAPNEFLLGYDYLDWRDAQTPFSAMGSSTGAGDCDLNEVNPERLRCGYIDAFLLPALETRPMVGRGFTPQDDRPDAPKVALISYAFWRARFGGDPQALGETIPLDGRSATIVGVMPAGFELPTDGPVDVLVPQALDQAVQRTRKVATLLWTVARLKDGVTPGQARAALEPLFQKSMQDVSPQFRQSIKLLVRPLKDRQVQDARLAAWILLAAVLAVLLIACANVANLLVARGASRRREFALRAALGASRGRLAGQTLAESLLIGLSGCAAGCAMAFLLVRLFVKIGPQGIPGLREAAIDGRVLLFALAASLVCSLLCGMAPAWREPQAEDLMDWRTVGVRRHWFRQGLVAAQVCASLALLTNACLLFRTVWNLQNQPLGMRTGGVATASIALGRTSYSDPARRVAFWRELEARLSGIPGAAAVAVADSLPPEKTLAGSVMFGVAQVEGRPPAQGAGGRVSIRGVTPQYFAALGIPILRGRGFTEEDRSSDEETVVLSDTMARRLFPGEDPLGKQMRPASIGPWRTVIGVGGNVKNAGLGDPDDPEIYTLRKLDADPGRRGVVAIRTAADPRGLGGWLRAQVAAVDPTLPVEVGTLDGELRRLTERPRFDAALLSVFAGLGLALAALGLYAVVSFLVAERTREIGVRMAMGATPGGIGRMVVAGAARPVAAGALAGAAASLLAARLLKAALFQVSSSDPLAISSAIAVLAGTALLAAWIPARRAARIDPMQALRRE
jgi:predicted permease